MNACDTKDEEEEKRTHLDNHVELLTHRDACEFKRRVKTMRPSTKDANPHLGEPNDPALEDQSRRRIGSSLQEFYINEVVKKF